MNILSELNELLTNIGVSFETGIYRGKATDEYVVIVPLADILEAFADNQPQNEIQEVRLSLYCKSNYIRLRNRLTKALLELEFTITDRRYIGFESETKYHHYVIDISKHYKYEISEEIGDSESRLSETKTIEMEE